MTARVFAATCATAIVFAGCGSVGPDWGFEESVDWDIGLGSTHGEPDEDAGVAAVDPCADTGGLACDPFTNAGCDADAGYACSFRAESDGGTGAFACLTDSTELEGAACDADDGPWCGPALACVPGDGAAGVCAPLCCEDGDCAASGASCAPFGYAGVEGPFGACEGEAPADGGLDG